MRDINAVILGGGRGERLKPLTNERAKPAVPFAGMYRLVDIPISNCLNSGIDKVYVLTQYQSMSLNRHVAQTYRFDAFSEGHVTVLAAEQTDVSAGTDWYQGTADAVRKQMHRFDGRAEREVLILSGDQVYLMNFREVIKQHRKTGADVTIAATRVTREDATRFGVMRIDADRKIEAFAEKPKEDEILDRFADPNAPDDRTHLGSMGIYVFTRRALTEALDTDQREDFGKHILPRMLEQKRKIYCYPFGGFWEDVGTISSYHRVNLMLTDAVPAFNLFHEQARLYTRARFLPPSKIGDAVVQRALVSDGAIIGDGATVQKSVLGIRSVIGPRCVLDRVVCNGSGWYDFGGEDLQAAMPLGIGPDSVLRRVIIDRDVRVGAGVHLVNREGVREYEDEHIAVRDGIIVVPRRSTVPDGYTF